MENISTAIDQICQEKKLSKERVLEAIEQALASAYRKDFGNKQQNLKVIFDPETTKIQVFDEKTVVEDLPQEEEEEEKEEEKKEDEEEKKRFNPKTEIQISEIKKDSDWKNIDQKAKKIKIGDIVQKKLEIPSDFGRIAAQTAKQVIIQRLREAERDTIYEKYKELEGTVINGIIQRRERYSFLIDLGDATAFFPPQEQIRQESYRPEQKIKFYLLSVEKTPKGPEIIVSRRHSDILIELFKMEIPEIANDSIQIKGIAREPGFRSKIAVYTEEESIDPIGACIGQRGVRIQTIINEIGGEKIDIIEYDEDPEKFIINALAPAKIYSLKVNEKEKTALAEIKKDQLSLAIGRDGQNVRLASKLTGWKIDIKEKKEEKEEEEKKEDKKEEKEEKEKSEKKEDKKEKKEDKEKKKTKKEDKKKDNKKKKTKKEKKEDKKDKKEDK